MDATQPEPFFADDSVELEIAFGAPCRQSRVTVAFRALLVLPHVVVLLLLSFVAIPLVVMGWFAALVLGRLPRWIAVYVMSVIAYGIRVNAYGFMLSGLFPSFSLSLSHSDYPIESLIGASQLSRAKVLFRWLLVIPAAVLASLVGNGLLVLSPVIWLVTLVLGRAPQALFSATAATIRYQARCAAYLGLVTDEYPHRLFGDVQGHLPDWESDEERQRRLDARVALSGAGKSLVGLVIALGIAVPIGQLVVRHERRSQPALYVVQFPQSPLRGNSAVVAAEARLEAAELDAVGGDEQDLGEAYLRFASSVSGIASAQKQLASVNVVVHDVRKMGRLLLAAAKSKDGGLALGIDPTDPPDSPGPSALNEEIASVLGPGPNGIIR